MNSDINVYGKSGDVEGGELYILRNLELDKLNIKMFSIEVDQHKTEIIEFMKSKGYKIETELRGDIIF